MAYPTHGVSAHAKQNIRPYPPLCTTRAQPLAGRAQPGGQLAGERGRSAPERGYAASERGHAQPPHVAFTRPEQPLHLVFLGLTHGRSAAYRSWGRLIEPRRPTRSTAGPTAGLERPPGHSAADDEKDAAATDGQHRQDGGESRWPEAAPGSPVLDKDREGRPGHPLPHRHAGPYGASFDGTERDGKTPVRGLTFERRWTRPDVHPYDEITWEYRTAGIANESGKSRLRAEGRRGPRLLEPARHQRRRQQVLPRPPRHARSARPPSAS